MPLLGFPGAHSQYPYFHAQFVNASPGAVIGNGGATIRTEASRPQLPAGSRFDPLLGVVPIAMGSGAGGGWAGDGRMGFLGQGYGGGSYGQQLNLAYSHPPLSPSSPAAPVPSSVGISKGQESNVTSPKRRRPPTSHSFAPHDGEGETKPRSSNEGTKKDDASASQSSTTYSAVRLTRGHYEMLVEHQENLVKEIAETELMMSVYEQQLNSASKAVSATNPLDEGSKRCDPSSKKRPSKREADIESGSKRKRG